MSQPINDGGPAFPRPNSPELVRNDKGQWAQDGMSLRDYFAAAALQGILSSLAGGHMVDGLSVSAKKANLSIANEVAVNAYEAADAMLKAREVVS